MSEKSVIPFFTPAELLLKLQLGARSSVVQWEPPDCDAAARCVAYLVDSLADVRRERAQLQQQLTEAARVNTRLEARLAKSKPSKSKRRAA
jgi:hypothetical protein